LGAQVALLDEEIERKGPLAESALSLSQRVAALEQELVDLTRERDRTALALRENEAGLRETTAERERAAGEHEQLIAELADLRGQKAAVETELATLSAEVRHQDSVFANLEVLKKEQDFLRGLIGTMVDEGVDARDKLDDLRLESASLQSQRLTLEKELVGKQAEIELIDKALLAKGRTLDGDVSNARAF
jgi:chromosome segregation ATPase